MQKKPAIRGEIVIAVVACVVGVWFFSSLGRLWPLADTNLNVPRPVLDKQARDCLAAHGFDPSDFSSVSYLAVSTNALDYVTDTFGADRAQSLIADGEPLVFYQVLLKRPGDPNAFGVSLAASGRVLGWYQNQQEDDAADSIDEPAARELVYAEMRRLGYEPQAWEEKGVSTDVKPARTDREFLFERNVSVDPELRQRITVGVSGNQVSLVSTLFVTPAAYTREQRAKDAAPTALSSVGLLFLAAAIVAAFVVFLVRLRDGSVRLGRAALWSSVVFGCSTGTRFLQDASNFSSWDPLWPYWISFLNNQTLTAMTQSWMLIVLLAIIAAGDSVDRDLSAGRGAALFALGRGRLIDVAVGLALWRGFAVGLLCGGVLAGSVFLIGATAGGSVAIQPRGFFFYGINSSWPAVSTLLFFTNVALMEELGYRFFFGSWLLKITQRKWIAITAPALIYGLTHTTLTFLPPAEPFWGRAVTMTLVGCVWGWAFFRYDALTVVVSHLMADLFIFTWPRLASGDGMLVAIGLLTMFAPLVLSVPWIGVTVVRLMRPKRAEHSDFA